MEKKEKTRKEIKRREETGRINKKKQKGQRRSE